MKEFAAILNVNEREVSLSSAQNWSTKLVYFLNCSTEFSASKLVNCFFPSKIGQPNKSSSNIGQLN